MTTGTRVLAAIFLVATMLSIALKVTPDSLRSVAHDRRWWIKALAANVLLMPLLGWLLVNAMPVSPDTALGLLLLAAAPGGLNAIQFTGRARGGLSYAAELLFVLSFLSFLISPLVVAVILPPGLSLTLPYGRVVAILLGCVVFPLVGGLAFRKARPRLAERLAGPMVLLGTGAFVAVVVLLLSWRAEAASELTRVDLAAMLTFILAAMGLGWLMGGPDTGARNVLATATSMRNAALALAIAVNSFPDRRADLAIIVFSGLMIPPNALLMVYHMARDKWRQHHAKVAGT